MAAKPKTSKKEFAKRKAKVFLVDDHPVMRHGLARLLNQETDLVVCGEGDDAGGTLQEVPRIRPDIVIADISLKDGMTGLELTKSLNKRFPKLPVLVLSMHKESLYAERALHAGARGYIMKQEATEKVIEAIRQVLNGKIYLSETMASQLLQQFTGSPLESLASPLARLSDRELEVFQLIGLGRSTRQIAETLCLSIKTIESYRAHIKEKLHLETATELLQQAIEWVKNESRN